MKYFDDKIKTMEELKKAYRNLAKQYHPDIQGGSEEAMKEINAEYEVLKARLDGGKTAAGEKDIFTEIINQIITFDIKIEIIGGWIWTFNAYKYKEELKKLGFWFAKTKKAWVWNGIGKTYKRNVAKDMNSIRKKYGSKEVFKQDFYIAG